MSYENTTVGLDNYKLIGVIAIPALSTSGNTISYEGKISDTLIGYGETAKIPKIIIGESAFSVTLLSVLGKPTDTFVAVVTGVTNYQTDETRDYLKLTFTYRRGMVADKLRRFHTIEPTASRIFQQGVYVGIVLEGDNDYLIKKTEGEYSAFYHGDKLYYIANKLQLSRRLDPGDANFSDVERIPTGLAIIGCTQKIPNRTELRIFTARFMNLIGYPMGISDTGESANEAAE